MIHGELCRVVTSDGLELVGFASLPPGSGTGLLHIHGLDGNFYENRFIDAVADACRNSNCAFLTANTRGHDYISDTIRTDPVTGAVGYARIGGMYERLADCVKDIRAWVGWLTERGCRRIVLQGHSHGAIKVLHYLTTTGDPSVCGLALLSPSDDFGLARQRLGTGFDQAVSLAADMVRSGREHDPMPAELFPYPTSAGAFLDTLGPRSLALAFNLSRTDRRQFPELNAVRVPVLLIVGTVEEAFVQRPEEYITAIRAELKAAPSFDSTIINGAPHNYLGHEPELGAALRPWLTVSVRAGLSQHSYET
ncbi:MAG: alpha/beta fold hydrolase [candidate division WOR-3 bacterium]